MTQNFDDLHDINQTEEYTRSYDIRYVAEIRHQGLGTYRILKDKDQWILDNKIEVQFKRWDEQWEKIVFKNQSQANKEVNLNLAEERTLEAKEKLDKIENLLVHTIDIDDTIDWNSLKDTKKFKVPNPKNSIEKEFKQIPLPESPSYKAIPLQPNQMHFQPKLTFMDKLLKSKAQKKIDHSVNSYKTAMTEWEQLVKQTSSYNSELDFKFNLLLQEVEKQK